MPNAQGTALFKGTTTGLRLPELVHRASIDEFYRGLLERETQLRVQQTAWLTPPSPNREILISGLTPSSGVSREQRHMAVLGLKQGGAPWAKSL